MISLHCPLFPETEGTVSYTHLDVYKRQGTRRVTVSYPDMDYIGFWHATLTEAPYVCIEPWSSLPSRQDIVEDLSSRIPDSIR